MDRRTFLAVIPALAAGCHAKQQPVAAYNIDGVRLLETEDTSTFVVSGKDSVVVVHHLVAEERDVATLAEWARDGRECKSVTWTHGKAAFRLQTLTVLSVEPAKSPGRANVYRLEMKLHPRIGGES